MRLRQSVTHFFSIVSVVMPFRTASLYSGMRRKFTFIASTSNLVPHGNFIRPLIYFRIESPITLLLQYSLVMIWSIKKCFNHVTFLYFTSHLRTLLSWASGPSRLQIVSYLHNITTLTCFIVWSPSHDNRFVSRLSVDRPVEKIFWGKNNNNKTHGFFSSRKQSLSGIS